MHKTEKRFLIKKHLSSPNTGPIYWIVIPSAGILILGQIDKDTEPPILIEGSLSDLGNGQVTISVANRLQRQTVKEKFGVVVL